MNKKNSKRKKGGKAIGVGSYGCSFRPALTCKNKPRPGYDMFYDNKISKLMINVNAEDEKRELEKVYSIIKDIPNNNKYFIPNSDISYEICELPERQDDTDNTDDIGNLNDINKCQKTLKIKTFKTDKGIKIYLNSIRDNYKIIQQEDGGISLAYYINSIDTMEFDKSSLNELNNKLCDLMKYGISEMNRRGLFHLDIKDNNMVINIPRRDNYMLHYDSNAIKDSKLRLIDWGLSKVIANDDEIKIIKNYQISYNNLFSTILFNNKELNVLNNILQFIDIVTFKPIRIVDNKELRKYFTNIINSSNKQHFDLIQSIMSIIYKDTSLVITTEFIIQRILDFLINIIDKYKDRDNKFDIIKYYNEVYRFNCDIYGILIIYIELTERMYKKGRITNSIAGRLYKVLEKYTFNSDAGITKIDVDILIKELREIFDLNTYTLSDRISKKLISNIRSSLLKSKKDKIIKEEVRRDDGAGIGQQVDDGAGIGQQVDHGTGIGQRGDVVNIISKEKEQKLPEIKNLEKIIKNLKIIIKNSDDEDIRIRFDKLSKNRNIILNRIIENIRIPEELIDIYNYCLIKALTKNKPSYDTEDMERDLISRDDARVICCIIKNIVKNGNIYGYKITLQELLLEDDKGNKIKKYNFNCKEDKLFSKIIGYGKKTKKNRKRLKKKKKTKNKK